MSEPVEKEGIQSEPNDGSWIDFIVRPKRAITRAISAGHLFEPWAILIVIEWLPITAILAVAAERTGNPKSFLLVASLIVVGMFVVTCLEAFMMFGCLWFFTRVFGARQKSRDFAISFAVASRGPALAGSMAAFFYCIVVMTNTPTENGGHSNWALFLGLAIMLLIAVWYFLLMGKAIRAVYDIPRFGLIFAVIVGGFVLPVVIPTDWMTNTIVGSYTLGAQSMLPALDGRDHILTNNAAYGLRSSLLGKYIISLGQPRRGDLVVFETPDTGEDYLKRVVAIGGDKIGIIKNQLVLNGKPVPFRKAGEHWYYQVDEHGKPVGKIHSTRWVEKLGDAEYSVLHRYCSSGSECFHFSAKNCDLETNTCVIPDFETVAVPEDHVFVMGDNRDNSRDSRFFGFVPVESIKGQVMLIYLPFERSGTIDTCGKH